MVPWCQPGHDACSCGTDRNVFSSWCSTGGAELAWLCQHCSVLADAHVHVTVRVFNAPRCVPVHTPKLMYAERWSWWAGWGGDRLGFTGGTPMLISASSSDRLMSSKKSISNTSGEPSAPTLAISRSSTRSTRLPTPTTMTVTSAPSRACVAAFSVDTAALSPPGGAAVLSVTRTAMPAYAGSARSANCAARSRRPAGMLPAPLRGVKPEISSTTASSWLGSKLGELGEMPAVVSSRTVPKLLA